MRHKIIDKPPVVSKFADYLKKEHKLRYEKDFMQLSKEKLFDLVDKYFEYQRNVKKLSESTLEKHISVLNKILPPVRPETRKFFTPDNRAKWRDGVAKLEGDRYNNPDKIIVNLKNIGEVYEAIAQLQRLTDARIGDVNRMQIDEENQRVYFPRSKGGRDRYVYFEHFKEDFEKVKHYKEVLDKALEEKSFSDIRKNEYYRALERACEKTGEPYHGSHPFRYEAVQRRYEVISQLPQEEQENYYRKILEDRGKSEEQIEKALNSVRERDEVAVAIISEELGHSRLRISREYLKLKGK
jgi:rRNA maturation protein Nop10